MSTIQKKTASTPPKPATTSAAKPAATATTAKPAASTATSTKAPIASTAVKTDAFKTLAAKASSVAQKAVATATSATTATNSASAAASSALAGSKGPQAKANMENLQALPAMKTLPASVQQKALETLASNPTSNATSQSLTSLVGSSNFKTLSADQQWKALDVFSKTTIDGQKSIVDLANRNVGSPPKSALLDKDAKGGTLLDSLHKIATGTMAEGFGKNGINKDSMIASIAQEAANPGQINQSARNTCGATSVQYLLANKNPAEYVRLMEGLLSPAGTAQMRNGDTLKRVGDSIAPDNATGRSHSERIFQSAMMDYSDGMLKSYSNTQDKSSFPIANLGNQGLMAWEVTSGMNAVLGGKFDTYIGGLALTSAGRKENMMEAIQNKLPGDAIALLKWSDDSNFGHFVAVDRVENGRVYFRNPWGSSVGATGSEPTMPPRKVEDGANGFESMTIQEFQKRLNAVSVPDNNIVPFFV